jgi:hypothetical protein
MAGLAPQVTRGRDVLRLWATGWCTLNAALAVWLVTSALTVGLPFTGAHDPETMRNGAALVTAGLVCGAAGAFFTAQDADRVSIDDSLIFSLVCQALPPLVTLTYAAWI